MLLDKTLSWLTLILLFTFPQGLLSSIAHGTLVKTPTGLTPIEQLSVGDIVFSYDRDHLIKNRITHIASTKIHPSYKVSTRETSFYASAEQLIFNPHLQDWIAVASLNAESQILSLTSGNQPCSVNSYEEVDGYDLSLEAPHNFLITEQEILVHNFFPALVLVPLVTAEGAVIAKGITCGVALLGAHLLHKRLAQKQLQQRESNPAPNSSPPIDPNDPEWKKKHPYGKYEDAPYHHTNSRGKKSPAPKDGQGALDSSIPIEGSESRISLHDGEFVVLRPTRPGLYHGYVSTWKDLQPKMKNSLSNAKLVSLSGKILRR